MGVEKRKKEGQCGMWSMYVGSNCNTKVHPKIIIIIIIIVILKEFVVHPHGLFNLI